jgi:hypothetical protein
LQARDLPADRLHRLVELAEVAHDEEQLAERHVAGVHALHPDEQDGAGAQGGDHGDQQTERPVDQRDAQAGAHPLDRAVHEAVLLAVLLAEGLDDAQGGHHLLHDGERGALQPLDLAMADA